MWLLEHELPVSLLPDALPSPVRAALDAWVGAALGDLGSAMEAVLLTGGIALGEFAPRWSDIDLCVVLTRALTSAEVEKLGRTQVALRSRFVGAGEAGWVSAQFVEGVLVGAHLLGDGSGRGHAWQLEADRVISVVGAGLEPFDRLVLARHAVAVTGALPAIAAPPRAALRAALRRDLDALELGVDRPPAWLAGVLHWGARSLAFWRDGRLLPKGQALDGEIARGGALAPAFAFARQMRNEGPASCTGHAAALRALFGAAAPHLLRALLPHA